MFEAIDRLVIAVKDMDKAKDFFSDLLEIDFDEPLGGGESKMRAVYSLFGLELVEATDPDSIVNTFIQKRGEGVFRVVVKVSDLEKATRKFAEKGVRAVGELNFGGVREIAFHPKDTYGVQMVLAEYRAKHPATVAGLEK
ncbi:Glyoxalase/bleomycin resistance protein/dioxygenase [sediment metagenome]|uniref:Glyoxalase/bleomycin resistance protein/dioxygenase n=1 Tax=sediment metagenome TaxID=749907 RepID=D9PM25_9ZZZZ